MSHLPRLVIDIDKLRNNAKALCAICHPRGVGVAAVTKCFCADERVTKAVLDADVNYLADSRLENIAKYPRDLKQKRILLRAPVPAETEAVVKGCDISLHSELATLEAMATATEAMSTPHEVVLMIDMGDLREGYYHTDRESILRAVDFVDKQPKLGFAGIGVNLTCYGAVIPDEGIMGRFAAWAEEIEARLGCKLEIVSGGNSSGVTLLQNGGMPKAVNNLRFGESLLRGVETAYLKPIEGLSQNAVVLEAGLIEVKEKPSYPEGEIGYNAFGEKLVYEDRGIRLRGIMGVGRQDTDPDDLVPMDEGVEIVGASSDHLIVDLTDANRTFKTGDTLRFTMGYSGLLKGFTSAYVDREYLEG